MTESLDTPEGLVCDLAAIGFGKEREEGAYTWVERHCAITSWGLDVALRGVGYRQPVIASLLYQSAFLVSFRNSLGHAERAQSFVIDAMLGDGILFDKGTPRPRADDWAEFVVEGVGDDGIVSAAQPVGWGFCENRHAAYCYTPVIVVSLVWATNLS